MDDLRVADSKLYELQVGIKLLWDSHWIWPFEWKFHYNFNLQNILSRYILILYKVMAARDEQCNDRQERKDQEDMMDAVGNYF